MKGKFLCGNDESLKINIDKPFGNKFFNNLFQIYIINCIVHRDNLGIYLNRIFLFDFNN